MHFVFQFYIYEVLLQIPDNMSIWKKAVDVILFVLVNASYFGIKFYAAEGI